MGPHSCCKEQIKKKLTIHVAIVEAPQIIKNRITLWSKNPTSRYACFWAYDQRKWNQVLKEIFALSSSFQHCLWYPRQGNNLNVHEWLNGLKKKSDGLYLHTMDSSAFKKEKILPFAIAWMNLEDITLSEISQTEKDKYWMISLICGI